MAIFSLGSESYSYLFLLAKCDYLNKTSKLIWAWVQMWTFHVTLGKSVFSEHQFHSHQNGNTISAFIFQAALSQKQADYKTMILVQVIYVGGTGMLGGEWGNETRKRRGCFQAS